ncbi:MULTISPECIES: hypothetical protein [Micromonospora]|uniref:hypothetical protein n=1 Tax=Micromonospora TaxID=1873 RepID=UPI0021C5F07A|nr:hypothetical protein [Micromonospora sp. Mcm103]
MSVADREAVPVVTVDATPQGRTATALGFAVAGAVAGVLLAVAWSFTFVDSVIGDNIANSLLGHDAKATAIGGSVAGLAFAFVSGLAGTFTACNVAAFGMVPQVTRETTRSGLRGLLAPLGWLTAGSMAVALTYGAVGVLLGDRLPQLSTATTAGGVPVRLVQASVVFGLAGLALLYLGLAALKLVPDPFAGRPRARLVAMGVIIGAFLIGRPFPLFHKLFLYAVADDNPAYGAAVFGLQTLGNMLVMVLVVVIASRLTGGRLLTAPSRRGTVLSGVALVLVGVFLIVYWDVRVPALFGVGWFPTAPWN